jgi:hypothetical protein
LVVGNLTLVNGASLLSVDGELMLGFVEPEERGLPPRLVARFFDRDGALVFEIDKNIVTVRSDAFDVSSHGSSFTVRSAMYKVDLKVTLYPPVRIVVEQANWRLGDWRLQVSEDSAKIGYRDSFGVAFNGGRALVEGPLLFDCFGEGQIKSKNVSLEGASLRSRPFESLVREGPGGALYFPFPVYALVNHDRPSGGLKFTLGSILPVGALALFTTKALAERSERPEGFVVQQLNHATLRNLLRDVAPKQGMTGVAIDPIVGRDDAPVQVLSLAQLLENLDSDPNFDPRILADRKKVSTRRSPS